MKVADEIAGLPPDQDSGEPEEPDRGAPRSWARVAALVAAMCFLAGVIGWWIGQTEDPSFSEVDVGFLDDMSRHHDGAINLGFAYLGSESDAVVGHFAREIVTTQSQEVAIMNGLLGEAGAAGAPDDGVVMDWMGAPVPVARMPGMPTTADLDALRSARALEADDRFTRLMIEHHAAGVEMADYEARNGDNATVTRLAAAMSRIQRTEIAELNGRRAALGLERIDVQLGTAHGYGE